ncbi:unnamed protein product [Gadus morhua 'NCC']
MPSKDDGDNGGAGTRGVSFAPPSLSALWRRRQAPHLVISCLSDWSGLSPGDLPPTSPSSPPVLTVNSGSGFNQLPGQEDAPASDNAVREVTGPGAESSLRTIHHG